MFAVERRLHGEIQISIRKNWYRSIVLGQKMMLEKKVLHYLRKRMEDYRAGLLERMEQFPEYHQVEINQDIKLSDLTGNLPVLEVQRSMREKAMHQIHQVENALQRMEDGTYGRCAHCGERIPLRRLRVMPHAMLCVRCKSRIESK
jgi:RNA polymerase-binding protein DksA